MCAKGFGNPCGHAISATLLASLLIYEFKGPGVALGLAWVSMISWARLLLGVNSLNQIIYGITIGINASCTVFYVFDYKRNVTRHFQKVIRGRKLEEKSVVCTKIFGALSIMVLIYLCIYLGVDIYFNSDKNNAILDNYWSTIKSRCEADTKTKLVDTEKMLFFY